MSNVWAHKIAGEIGRGQNGRRRANEAFLLKDCTEGLVVLQAASAVEEQLTQTFQPNGTNTSFIETLKM